MKRYGHVCILRSLLGAAILITYGELLQAQVDTGSMDGMVTDSSGAVVNGARVTLTNEGTGTALSTTTGAGGTTILVR